MKKTVSIESILKTAFSNHTLLLSGYIWDDSLKFFPSKTENRIEFNATLIDEWDEENENYFTIEATLYEFEDDPVGYYKIIIYGDPDEFPTTIEGEYNK